MVQESTFVATEESIKSIPLLSELFSWPETQELIPYNSKVDILSNGKRTEENSDKTVTTVFRKSVSSTSSKRSGSDQVDLDLTGSPLKASFTLDEDEEDDLEVVSILKKSTGPSFLPLQTRIARKIISQKNKSLDHATFAVCDAQDKTVFLGSSKLGKNLTFFKVLNQGFYSSKDAHAFKDILKAHESLEPTSASKSVLARAVYNMSEPIGSEMIATEVEDLSSLKLRFSWSKPTSLLETPPGEFLTILQYNTLEQRKYNRTFR